MEGHGRVDCSVGDHVIEINAELSRCDLRCIEINRTKALIVSEHEISQGEVPVDVSGVSDKFQPDLSANQLELANFDLARSVRIQINRRMFGDKVVRPIANNDRRIGNVNALRENIGDLDFLFRIRRARTQRSFVGVHHDFGRAYLDIPEGIGDSVAQEGEESVVDSGIIEVYRFHIARSGRHSVQVPNSQVGEYAAFEAEIDL